MLRSSRIIVVTLAAGAMLVITGMGAAGRSPQRVERRIAVTIDDLPTATVTGNDIAVAEQTTATLLAALARNGVPAIGFVNERKLQRHGIVDARQVALLERWLDAGFELGNHTYSHADLHTTPLADFQREVLEGERVTRQLLASRNKRLEFFRHPFLHTGRSLEIKASFEAFLRRHGYRVAPVTVDNYDYVFAAAYDRIGGRGDLDGRRRVADEYVAYMDAVVRFYEEQAVKIVKRDIRQTLLLHASALNADTFDRLAESLRGRGYRFVSLPEALQDPAYQYRDEYVGPAGMTWLHRWALTDGMKGSTFAGEPIVPAWIDAAAK